MTACSTIVLPSMPRFYCPQPLHPGAIVDLPETVAHHLHVVRQQPGDELVLFNGAGGQARARLVEIGKRRATAEVVAIEAVEAELPCPITLAQGLPEGTKMDWIVEKAVELGVAAIVPLAARRSVVKLAGERADKRLAHWQAVVISASEQCGRNRLAEVAPLQDFNRWIAEPAPDVTRILLSPRADASLAAWARVTPARASCLLVGPEGGWSAEEENAALASGAIALSMGPRVLRTETAGLAALAVLAAAWGGI
jgi:16S rRNA (uracil1498-N3)-methyltransferase